MTLKIADYSDYETYSLSFTSAFPSSEWTQSRGSYYDD